MTAEKTQCLSLVKDRPRRLLIGPGFSTNNTFDLQWKQIEKIKKRLIKNKFQIKGSIPYDIMLSEMGVAIESDLGVQKEAECSS